MNTKLFFSLFLILFSAALFAQDQRLTEEQWTLQYQKTMDSLQTLQSVVTPLEADVKRLNDEYTRLGVVNCDEELLKIVGATRTDVDAYRKMVNDFEGKLRRREGPKENRVADLAKLRSSKISALPEFFTKVNITLPKMLEDISDDQFVETSETSVSGLTPPKKGQDLSYTVVKGDCLWFIARRKEHYGNGFAWPKIYNANKDQIRNPNLIYPKQQFRIPPLTEDEKAKFDKLRKNYKPAPAK